MHSQDGVMQTRPIALTLPLFLACAAAIAQVGPSAADEPLRSMSSANIRDAQIAPAREVTQRETTPSESARIGASDPTRIASPSAGLSLDEALIAATPPARRETPAASESAANLASQSLGSPKRTALVGADSDSSASNPMLSRGSMLQTILALGGVLLLIFGLATLYKRLAKSQGGLAGAIGAGGSAPSGLVEVLGRYPVSSKMTLVVMRFDRRILLLSHAGGGRGKNAGMGSMSTLCELDQPEDVASVLLKVRDLEGDSIARSFAQTLREADESQGRYLDDAISASEQPRVRMPARRRQPAHVVTNDSGDRAEFGTMTESEAAAGVLRRRLAAMREAEQQMNPYGTTR